VRDSAIRCSYTSPGHVVFQIMALMLFSGFATSTSAAVSEKSATASSLLYSQFALGLGGFFPRIEDTLGLDRSSSSAWIDFNWRFLPRHQLQVEWFQLDRDGSDTADTQFTPLAFALDLGGHRGSLIELDAMVGYQPSKHFGLGAGFKYFNLNLQAHTDRVTAGYEYQLFGPAIFGYAIF